MKIKKGDMVEITDGSYAVRVDKYEAYPSIGLCRDDFEVLKHFNDDIKCWSDQTVHDVYIQNTKTGAIYLHSAGFVRVSKKQPTLVSAECRAEVRRLIVEFEDNLRIALAESRKKWRVGSGKTLEQECGICGFVGGFAGDDACKICEVLLWGGASDTFSPCSCIKNIKLHRGIDESNCRIMQAEFDRIEREFLG